MKSLLVSIVVLIFFGLLVMASIIWLYIIPIAEDESSSIVVRLLQVFSFVLLILAFMVMRQIGKIASSRAI
ncbi:MAG: hypothetical protein ACW99Q_13610 [Candidatus Kariarchaeaceae archaeon]|jgi:hypothetical protein